jgi:hypothetical protein
VLASLERPIPVVVQTQVGIFYQSLLLTDEYVAVGGGWMIGRGTEGTSCTKK